MLSKLLYNKGHKPENCECKERFHEMKEKTCDETAKKAFNFVKPIRR